MPALLYLNVRRPASEVRKALVAAADMGYDVVLMTDSPPAWIAPFVAHVEVVDTFDLEQSLETAAVLTARYDIRGVVPWADRDVELAAHICEALGLPGPTREAARLARNKFEMKRKLAGLGDWVPRHARIMTRQDVPAAVETVGFPAVLKPVGASGSKGIFEVRDADELDRALDELARFTDPSIDPIFRLSGSELILEEYVGGVDVCVEGWVHAGDVCVVGVTDMVTTEPWHLEVQHIFPSQLAADVLEGVHRHSVEAITGLGLDNCAFHIDGRVDHRGFHFLEVGARIAGDYHTSHLIPLATGLDFYTQVLRIAVGEPPVKELPEARRFAGVRFLFADRTGLVGGITGLDRLLAQPAVEHVFVETPVGSRVGQPPRDFAKSRVAAVLAQHTRYEDLAAALAGTADVAQVQVIAAQS